MSGILATLRTRPRRIRRGPIVLVGRKVSGAGAARTARPLGHPKRLESPMANVPHHPDRRNVSPLHCVHDPRGICGSCQAWIDREVLSWQDLALLLDTLWVLRAGAIPVVIDPRSERTDAKGGAA